MFPLEGQFTTITVSFAIRKNHPLFDQLSASMLNLLHQGIIDEIFAKYGGENRLKSTKKRLIPLSVSDIQGLFVIVVAKLGLALVWTIAKKILKGKRGCPSRNTVLPTRYEARAPDISACKSFA